MTETAQGNCFQAAGDMVHDLFLAGLPADVYLCHGTALGTGGEVKGVRYCHAWVEIGGAVVDRSNGNVTAMIRELYYSIGTIRDVVRYAPEEAARLMLDTGHYGPWDPRFKVYP